MIAARGLLAVAAAGFAVSFAAPIGRPCTATMTSMEVYADMDLTGKVAVVTGADSGIGLEVATALAARKATVVLAIRKTEEATNTSDYIKQVVPGANVVIPSELFDLSSFAQVRAYAKSLQSFEKIDILVNDAAIDTNPHKIVTKDGFELAFQADYPSQWLLTELLLPQIRKAKGRIVQLVSKAYRLACVQSKRWNCMDLNRLPPPVIEGNQTAPVIGTPVTNYGIGRLLMIRYTEDLAEKEKKLGSGVTVFSVNPGFVKTKMAKADNLSPFFKKLACETETRPGSGCPVSAEQGALTPTFLAMSPDIGKDSGKFFEWCAPANVQQCMDEAWGPAICPGFTQKYKDGLFELTSKWLANFSAPLEEKAVAHLDDAALMARGRCPGWLEPMCDKIQNFQGCLKCSAEASKCIGDPVCKKSLTDAVKCMAKMSGKSANEQLTCLVPINTLRDSLFFCLLDKNDCLPIAKDNTPYPACRDDDMVGDSKFDPKHLLGDWWKLRAWTKGELYECRDCGQVTFRPYEKLPYPTAEPEDTRDYNIIASTWLEKDPEGKKVFVNETSLFGPRPGHKGYPNKQNHRGVMYGLSYLENFTIVHDGTQEREPFIFLYGCGSTKQGRYVTAFVMGKKPTASVTLERRTSQVAAQNGFDDYQTPGVWCVVDNSCPTAQPSTQLII